MVHEMTAFHLINAYGGESMAHMRYSIWGNHAEKEKFSNVARLFRAISYAEMVHATNHYNANAHSPKAFLVNSNGIFGVGSTAENLQGGIDGEMFEIEEMYPVYLNAAQFQNEKIAATSFHYALSAEKIHAALFQKALTSVEDGHDVSLGQIGICGNCGHTIEGEPPDRCPICNVTRDRYRVFN